MFIEFRMTNFRSYRDETILSAETGARLSKYKLTNTFQKQAVPVLKNLLVFGPNGAGKTQIYNALLLMREIVYQGGAPKVTDNLPYDPFKFDQDSNEQPTTFGIRIEVNQSVYDYEFSYTATQVVHERLTKILGKRKQDLFEFQDGQPQSLGPGFVDPHAKLRNNALYLYYAADQNNQIAGEIYRWFVEDVVYIDNENPVVKAEFVKLMLEPTLKQEMLSFLRFADFNIVDIIPRKIPVNIPTEFVQQIKGLGQSIADSTWMLFTVHKKYDQAGQLVGTDELPLNMESLGTRKLFVMVLAMIFAQINHDNKLILIDEFDDSLHFELANTLIKIFNSTENQNQYVVSTHTVDLLDSNVRVDQIYFVEKDFRGISDLASAFDFTDARGNGRRDVKFAKRYLQGQYGALPVIDTENLLSSIKHARLTIRETVNGTSIEKETD